MKITLEEAYNGAQRILQIDGRRLEGKIPAGAQTGTRIRLAGLGRPGLNGQKGDLYLVVEVQPDRRFERKGNDLYTDVPVDLYTAILGGEIRVTTLNGQVMLKVPAGTQPDQKIRLSGLGMPQLRDPKSHGDLYAVIKVQVPRKLSADQRKLFEKLRDNKKG